MGERGTREMVCLDWEGGGGEGGGSAWVRSEKGGAEGVLEGSERPEAG